VFPHLSTGRVLTTELVSGSSWKEMASWDQEQRNLAGETLFRFMSHSLYGLHAFNGDPHPGNYMFHGDGKVTFLDFGLVKHFTDLEMATFVEMVKAAAYDQDAVSSAASSRTRGCCNAARRSRTTSSATTSRSSTRTSAPMPW
jgi:predicted unusual protein kinase regulating ubiquinone biosynthesis (AarF/ABC1/UbiB family)